MIFLFVTLFILIKSTEMPLLSKILHTGNSENSDQPNWFFYDPPFLPMYETTHRLIRKKHHKLKNPRNNGEIHMKSRTFGDWHISGRSRQKPTIKLRYAIPSQKNGHRRTFDKSSFKIYPQFQTFSKQQIFKKSKDNNVPVIKNYDATHSRVVPKDLFPDLGRYDKFKSNIRLRTAAQMNEDDIFEDGVERTDNVSKHKSQVNNESKQAISFFPIENNASFRPNIFLPENSKSGLPSSKDVTPLNKFSEVLPQFLKSDQNITALNESKSFPFPVVKMATAKPFQDLISIEKSGSPFQQVPLDSSIFESPESKEQVINSPNFNQTLFLPSNLFPQQPSTTLNESTKNQIFLAPNSQFSSLQSLQQKGTMNQPNIFPGNMNGVTKANHQFLPFLFPIANATYPNSSGVFMMQALPFVNDSKSIHLPLFNSEHNTTFNSPFLSEQRAGTNTGSFSSNEQKMLPSNMNQMFQQILSSQNANHMFEQEAEFEGKPENIQSSVTNLPEGNKELQLAFPSFGNSNLIFQQIPASFKGQNTSINFFKHLYNSTPFFTNTSSMIVSSTTLSPFQYLQTKLKEIKKIHSRFGRKGRILVASVAAVLISITVILILISTCKDYKDKKRKRYPFKKKNTFTLLRATMEQQKDLLRKISTVKYDNLNAEEEDEQ